MDLASWDCCLGGTGVGWSLDSASWVAKSVGGRSASDMLMGVPERVRRAERSLRASSRLPWESAVPGRPLCLGSGESRDGSGLWASAASASSILRAISAMPRVMASVCQSCGPSYLGTLDGTGLSS